MRLLIDLQCLQSTSAVRGIGRYALSLSRALVEAAGRDDRIEVLLNGGDEQTRLLRARSGLETFLPPGGVHVFDAPWPWQHDLSDSRRRDAEVARTAAIRSLRPDVVLVGSVFEGDRENVLSIDSGIPTAAVLYDLIPAADPGTYLLGPGADSYWRRFKEMQQLDLLLAISDYSGRQARALAAACPPVVPIWGGPYPSGLFDAFETRAAAAAPGLPRRYLLTVGGDHPRKNLDRLVLAWARVPKHLRSGTPLTIACRLNVGTVRRLLRLSRRNGLKQHELVLTGEVNESALTALYRGALAFVFPSTDEGLGLPPLEAMSAGCPTTMARGSSLSELATEPEAFFDGTDVDDMARAIRRLLEDPAHLDRLRAVAAEASARFTWTQTASLAWAALREVPGRGACPAPPAPRMTPDPARLVQEPAALRLDAVPAIDVDAALAAAESDLGITTTLPAGTVATLSPSTALVVPDDAVARQLVASGLLEVPVVANESALPRVNDHDVYAALRPCARDITHPADLVHALRQPPRWSLERPWPVWLHLTSAPAPAPALDDRVVVTGGPRAVVLARSVDRVLVEEELAGDLAPDLQRARCLGTEVVVLGDRAALPWAAQAPDLATALREPAARTTGWPWRE